MCLRASKTTTASSMHHCADLPLKVIARLANIVANIKFIYDNRIVHRGNTGGTYSTTDN